MNIFIFKKTVDDSLKSILLALLLSVAGLLNAQDFTVGDLNYSVTVSGVIVTGHVDEYPTGALIIPETVTYNGNDYPVTSIDIGVFQNCSGLTSLTLPNSMQSIGPNAFKSCGGITSFNIPNSVYYIGFEAFYATGWWNSQPNGIVYKDNCCLGRKGDLPAGPLEIAEGTRLIGDGAVRYSGLTSLTLPSSLGRINDEAFLCRNLTSIETRALTPPILGEDAFDHVDHSIPVTVPQGTLEAYQSTLGWSRFDNFVEASPAVTTIDEIHVDGFTAPVFGAHPDMELTVPSDANYSIDGVAWFVDDHAFDVTPETLFGEGVYYMRVDLVPADGYSFDENATVYFNGDATICDAAYNQVFDDGSLTVYTIDFEVSADVPTYTLTVSCDPSMGAVTGNGTYAAGTQVAVEAIAYKGYAFDSWNDGVTANPRTVTLTGNMTLVAFFKGTGVNETGATALSLYPNPAKDVLRIEGLESNATVEIYNSLGAMVKSVIASTDEEISVSDLPQGIYMLRCGRQAIRFVKE